MGILNHLLPHAQITNWKRYMGMAEVREKPVRTSQFYILEEIDLQRKLLRQSLISWSQAG